MPDDLLASLSQSLNLVEAKKLVDSIRLNGSKIKLVDGKAMYTPSKAMAPEVAKLEIATLRANKAVILAYLTAVTGVKEAYEQQYVPYDIGDGLQLHSPTMDPAFVKWRERMNRK